MPCSWKMSPGGKGAARKAHQYVSKRHVPTLFHEAGVPFEQAKSDGISSALGKLQLFPIWEIQGTKSGQNVHMISIVPFPSSACSPVLWSLCFFGGIWLVLANSTNWAFRLERSLPCKREAFVLFLFFLAKKWPSSRQWRTQWVLC